MRPIFSVFLFTLIILISSSAYAEYYLVYSVPEPIDDCFYECIDPCYHHISVRSPYRHADKRGSEQMEEYAWISN